MRPRVLSATTSGRLFAVVVGFMGVMVLVNCGGGSGGSSTTTPTGTPAVSLSGSTLVNNTLTFTSAENVPSAAQTVTVTNTGSATLTFTSIQASSGFTASATQCGTGIVAGASCLISVTYTPTSTTQVNGTLTITDNASGSPQTVSLSGTGISVSLTYNGGSVSSLTFSGVTVGTSSSPQVVTLTNVGTSALTSVSISVTAGSSNFSQINTCGSSVSAGGSCTISVTFTPQTSGTLTGTLTVNDSAGMQTVGLSGSNIVANTASVTVGFGPNGYLGPPSATTGSYYNGIFTTVSVCSPGSTTNCASVPNVLVDTGSVGLRVLSTAISSVTLPQVNDPTTGSPLYACVQYGDLSYTWGPMQMANVQIGGETASQLPASVGGTANTGIPIQVIAAGQTPPSEVGVYGITGAYYNACLYYPGSTTATGGLNDDTVQNLGANGILGIGNYPVDCGTNCETVNNDYEYFICESIGSATCDYQAASLTAQAWNPVAAFPVDNNGVSIQLPSIPAQGQATASGTLTFGIGTQSNNGLSGATVYELDNNGNFGSVKLNGITYSGTNYGGSFIDSGSNGLFISDETTLATTDCTISGPGGITDIGYYCPGSPLNLTLTLAGSNGTQSNASLNIDNALNLFSANTSFAVFSDLGGPSCVPVSGSPCTAATDYFDLGLPFFFGQPHGVFVGISGGTTYPNGYWAF